MVFPLQLGGYYAYTNEDGTYGVWRLLFLDDSALHYAAYSTKFDHKPTVEEAVQAKRTAMHVPQGAGTLLLRSNLSLLGHHKLSEDDMQSFRLFMADQGYDATEVDKMVATAIKNSTQSPFFVKLTEDAEQDDKLTVEQPTEQEAEAAAEDWGLTFIK